MSSQSDWTSPLPEEPETFPGTLRGYRDFLDTRSSLAAVSAGYVYAPIGENDSWQAKCTKFESHEAPVRECTCGFYINYFMGDSFYTESPGKPRGVVEASGRIVLSRKGFRAQKMKLVALWSPYVQLWKYIESEMPHVKLFWDRNEIYDAYPQDDLTSLIGTKESRFPTAQQGVLNPAPWVDWTVQNFNYNPTSYNPISNIQAAQQYITQQYVYSYSVPSYLTSNYNVPSHLITVQLKDGGQLVVDTRAKTVQFYVGYLGYLGSSTPLEKISFDTCTVNSFPSSVVGYPDAYELIIEAPSMQINVNATEGTYVVTQKL